MNNQAARIALVTGANKGIGYETARQIAEAGTRVLLGARDPALGEAAAAALRAEGLDVRFVQIDLLEPAMIESAAGVVEAEHGRLDVLVNNAGIADRDDGPPSTVSLDVVRRTFDTNLFGTLAVTQAMLPLLHKSTAGRVVNVSSSLGSLVYNADPGWENAAVKLMGYNASKAALNMLTIQLAAELEGTGIKVNAANPGYTATDLNGHQGHLTVSEGAAIVVRLALLPDDGPAGGFFNAEQREPW